MVLKREDRRINISEESALHFPLAALGGYAADGLFKDDSLRDSDEVILALAHAYNDLKAALIFWEINREFSAPPPAEGEISKFFGQNVGLDNYAFRLQVGILVELIQLLKDKKDILESPIWKKVLKKLSKQTHQDWLSLIQLVRGATKKGTFEKSLHTFLVKVRAHGGYHYNQTKPFAEGYEKHFAQANPEAAHAYVCIGRNLEETRFFFADAAISTLTKSWRADLGRDFDIEFRKYLGAAHSSLRSVICTYFKVQKIPYTRLE